MHYLFGEDTTKKMPSISSSQVPLLDKVIKDPEQIKIVESPQISFLDLFNLTENKNKTLVIDGGFGAWHLTVKTLIRTHYDVELLPIKSYISCDHKNRVYII